VFGITETEANLLRTLQEHGGEATTSELKKEMGADHPQKVKYRMDKLEDQALVEKEYQGLSETGAQLPNLYRLTDDARSLLDDYADELPGDGFENDVDARLSQLTDEIAVLRDRIEQLETAVEELNRQQSPDFDPDPWSE